MKRPSNVFWLKIFELSQKSLYHTSHRINEMTHLPISLERMKTFLLISLVISLLPSSLLSFLRTAFSQQMSPNIHLPVFASLSATVFCSIFRLFLELLGDFVFLGLKYIHIRKVLWNAPKRMWKMIMSCDSISLKFWNAPKSMNFIIGSFSVLKMITCFFFEMPNFLMFVFFLM